MLSKRTFILPGRSLSSPDEDSCSRAERSFSQGESSSSKGEASSWPKEASSRSDILDLMLSVAAVEPLPLSTDADGVIRVAGTRVTLDTVIDTFITGASPEVRSG